MTPIFFFILVSLVEFLYCPSDKLLYLQLSFFIHNVSPFNLKVNEIFPFSIALSWKGSGPDTQNGGADQTTLVFPKGNPIPSIKALTFYRSGNFSVDVQYADVGDLQAPAKISTYTVRSHVAYEIVYLHALISLVAWSLAKFINISLYMCRLVLSSLLKVRGQR